MKFINEVKTTYLQYLEKYGHRPLSIKSFCQLAKLTETEFESYFYSFEWLEDSIWQDLAKWTVQLSEQYENFAMLSLRNKLTIFYHTFLQLLNSQQNFVKVSLRESSVLQTDLRTYPNCLADFKIEMYHFLAKHHAATTLTENSWADYFWLQALLIIEKWQKDTSPNKEDTQALIEGGLNFIFKTT